MNVRLKEIPIGLIDARENVRTIRDDDQDAALAANVRENGVLQPVCVAQMPGSERYQLIYGGRRLAALRQGGQTTIVVQVLDELPSTDERTIRQIAENSARVPLHPADLLTAIGGLSAAGWSGATIAKRLGEHESTVCRWIIVSKNATPVMRARIRAGTLCLSGAYELCKVAPESSDALLAAEPEHVRLSRDAVCRKIKSLQHSRRRRARPAATIQRITASVGRAQSVTIAGRELSLDLVIQWLGELLSRATAAQAQGLDLAGFSRGLKARGPAVGTTAP